MIVSTADRVARGKSEIIADVNSGQVPADKVRCFADLHDYVDANGYGGFFDEDEDMDEETIEQANAVQDLLDAWIKAGGLNTDGLIAAICDGRTVGPFCYLMPDGPRPPLRMVYFPARDLHVGAQFVRWNKTHFTVQLWGDGVL